MNFRKIIEYVSLPDGIIALCKGRGDAIRSTSTNETFVLKKGKLVLERASQIISTADTETMISRHLMISCDHTPSWLLLKDVSLSRVQCVKYFDDDDRSIVFETAGTVVGSFRFIEAITLLTTNQCDAIAMAVCDGIYSPPLIIDNRSSATFDLLNVKLYRIDDPSTKVEIDPAWKDRIWDVIQTVPNGRNLLVPSIQDVVDDDSHDIYLVTYPLSGAISLARRRINTMLVSFPGERMLRLTNDGSKIGIIGNDLQCKEIMSVDFVLTHRDESLENYEIIDGDKLYSFNDALKLMQRNLCQAIVRWSSEDRYYYDSKSDLYGIIGGIRYREDKALEMCPANSLWGLEFPKVEKPDTALTTEKRYELSTRKFRILFHMMLEKELISMKCFELGFHFRLRDDGVVVNNDNGKVVDIMDIRACETTSARWLCSSYLSGIKGEPSSDKADDRFTDNIEQSLQSTHSSDENNSKK